MVDKVDKYKNNLNNTLEIYQDVYPLDYFLGRKYDIVISDPPYSTQGGNHNSLDCDLMNSKGNIEFNEK
jgi:hypothetical protein